MNITCIQLLALASKLDTAGFYVEAEGLDQMVRRITEKRNVPFHKPAVQPVNQHTKQPVNLDPKHETNILSDHKLLEDDLEEDTIDNELLFEDTAA